MFNEFSQLVMSLLMIAGRLEMYAMVIVFARSFWKPDKAVAIWSRLFSGLWGSI